MVIRKWALVKQRKLLKINNKILSNLFDKEYGLKLHWENLTLQLWLKGLKTLQLKCLKKNENKITSITHSIV